MNGELSAAGAEVMAAEPRSLWIDLFPLFMIVSIFYFLIIRPQQQEKAKHETMLDSLVKGNKVVTAAGIHGRIIEVAESTVVLEIGDKTRITIDKAAVARRVDADNK